jgi:hypothetical protein
LVGDAGGNRFDHLRRRGTGRRCPCGRRTEAEWVVESDIQIPSLTGLIQPEKMGMFTDNPCRISDNEGHLLSDNAADRDLLSGNSCDILSNIHLLSDITVTVQITIHHGDATTAKPKNSDAARKTKKAQKDKASRKKKP